MLINQRLEYVLVVYKKLWIEYMKKSNKKTTKELVCNGRVPKDIGEYNRWYNEYMSNKHFEEEQFNNRNTCLHPESYREYLKDGRERCECCGRIFG